MGLASFWEKNKLLILWEAVAVAMSLETGSFGPFIALTLFAVFAVFTFG